MKCLANIEGCSCAHFVAGVDMGKEQDESVLTIVDPVIVPIRVVVTVTVKGTVDVEDVLSRYGMKRANP